MLKNDVKSKTNMSHILGNIEDATFTNDFSKVDNELDVSITKESFLTYLPLFLSRGLDFAISSANPLYSIPSRAFSIWANIRMHYNGTKDSNRFLKKMDISHKDTVNNALRNNIIIHNNVSSVVDCENLNERIEKMANEITLKGEPDKKKFSGWLKYIVSTLGQSSKFSLAVITTATIMELTAIGMAFYQLSGAGLEQNKNYLLDPTGINSCDWEKNSVFWYAMVGAKIAASVNSFGGLMRKDSTLKLAEMKIGRVNKIQSTFQGNNKQVFANNIQKQNHHIIETNLKDLIKENESGNNDSIQGIVAQSSKHQRALITFRYNNKINQNDNANNDGLELSEQQKDPRNNHSMNEVDPNTTPSSLGAQKSTSL